MMCYVFFNVWNNEAASLFRTLRDKRSKNVKIWLSDTAYGGLCPKSGYAYAKDIQKASEHAQGKNYSVFEWNLAAASVAPIFTRDFIGLLEQMTIQQDALFVVFDQNTRSKGVMSLFRDAIQIAEYPDVIFKLRCYNQAQLVIQYLVNQGILPVFQLEGHPDFVLSSLPEQQGAPVYKHKKSGYYWYRDQLHKTHYEVFDSLGKKHMGEADLSGVLDTTKADCKKKPIIK